MHAGSRRPLPLREDTGKDGGAGRRGEEEEEGEEEEQKNPGKFD